MSSSPIRILYYPDRIVLQNIRGFLNDKNVDLSDINAIIDATNKLATNVEQPESSFLVLPFDGQPTETNKEPVGRPLGVEAAVGFLGVLHLFSGPFAIFALQVKQVGQLPGAIPIYAIVKVKNILGRILLVNLRTWIDSFCQIICWRRYQSRPRIGFHTNQTVGVWTRLFLRRLRLD